MSGGAKDFLNLSAGRNLMKPSRAHLGLPALFLALLAVASTSFAQQKPSIRIEGSGTVYPITEAVLAAYQKRGDKIDVKLTETGTSAGFRSFCTGDVAMANASRRINAKEAENCTRAGVSYLEFPVAWDSVTLIANKDNTWAKHLTLNELRAMWRPDAYAKVLNWKQVRADFPDSPLKLYGVDSKHGTFEFFTEVVVGTPKLVRGDYGSFREHSDVVDKVLADKSGLGFVAYSHAAENADKLSIVAVDFGKGPVKPSRETVISGAYDQLSRLLFIYVNEKTLQQNKPFSAFVDYYLHNAGRHASFAFFTPLAEANYATNRQKFGEKKSN